MKTIAQPNILVETMMPFFRIILRMFWINVLYSFILISFF